MVIGAEFCLRVSSTLQVPREAMASFTTHSTRLHHVGKSKSVDGMRQGGQTFGDRFVEDAYAYRIS